MVDAQFYAIQKVSLWTNLSFKRFFVPLLKLNQKSSSIAHLCHVKFWFRSNGFLSLNFSFEKDMSERWVLMKHQNRKLWNSHNDSIKLEVRKLVKENENRLELAVHIEINIEGNLMKINMQGKTKNEFVSDLYWIFTWQYRYRALTWAVYIIVKWEKNVLIHFCWLHNMWWGSTVNIFRLQCCEMLNKENFIQIWIGKNREREKRRKQ